MATKQLPILTVFETGKVGFERFYIEDDQGRVWTGDKFEVPVHPILDNDGYGPKPLLYNNRVEVRQSVHAIMKSHFPNVAPVKYVVPVFVEVYSLVPLDVSEVAQYLSNTASLQMNTPLNGNGPGDSLVLPAIMWHRIEEISDLPDN